MDKIHDMKKAWMAGISLAVVMGLVLGYYSSYPVTGNVLKSNTCRDRCGNYDYNAVCYCDESCNLYGDCCPDYHDFCIKKPSYCDITCTFAGQRRCDGANAEVCAFFNYSCLKWGNTTYCPGGCSNGFCKHYVSESEKCWPFCTIYANKYDNWVQVCNVFSNHCYGCDKCTANLSNTCTNECSKIGMRNCYNKTSYECMNLDSDPCFEWKIEKCTFGCSIYDTCKAVNTTIVTDNCPHTCIDYAVDYKLTWPIVCNLWHDNCKGCYQCNS